MPATSPAAMLCLLAGLAVGTTGGYFWGADSQPATRAEVAASSGTQLVRSDLPPAAGSASSISAAIQNPTGLRLVGTVVQPERSKSKAWVMQVSTDTTQAYGEGDALPDGYRLNTISADELQVSKDGYNFAIRRAAASSGENLNAPCQGPAIAQNGPYGSKPGRPEQSSRPRRGNSTFGLGTQNRQRSNNQSAPVQTFNGGQNQSSGSGAQSNGSQPSQQRSQVNGARTSTHKSWGTELPLDGDDGSGVEIPASGDGEAP